MKKIHIIFSPHLDDAVFSLGGFIAKNAPNVVVVTFFAGKPATPILPLWDRLCGFKNSNIAIQSRLQENATAFSLLNVPPENIINVAYLDIQYRIALGLHTAQDTLQLKEGINTAMNDVLQKYSDSALMIYGPAMKLHPDHEVIHESFINLTKNFISTSQASFYLYQDLPYTYYFYAKQRILHRFSSRTKIINSLPFIILKQTTAKLIAHSIQLSRYEFKDKVRAVNLYASQFVGLRRPLLWIITHFSKVQAKLSQAGSEHCEIVYEVTHI